MYHNRTESASLPTHRIRLDAIIIGFSLLAMVVMFTGCTPAVRKSDSRRGDLATALRAETARWSGTPYQWGGNTRSGIDCSGFAVVMCKRVLGVRIPRTTADQVLVGREVSGKKLKPGDLVFFRLPGNNRHVGVYLGKGEFAHATKSKGVCVSQLSADYWKRCWWTARRVR